MPRRLLVAALGASVLLTLTCGLTFRLSAATAANDGPIHVSISLAAGPLTLRRLSTDTSTSGAVVVRLLVSDARGSGGGWHLRGRALAADSIVERITVSCLATCTLPQTSLSYPRTLTTSASDALIAVKDSGMGRMVVTLTLSAPAAFSLRP